LVEKTSARRHAVHSRLGVLLSLSHSPAGLVVENASGWPTFKVRPPPRLRVTSLLSPFTRAGSNTSPNCPIEVSGAFAIRAGAVSADVPLLDTSGHFVVSTYLEFGAPKELFPGMFLLSKPESKYRVLSFPAVDPFKSILICSAFVRGSPEVEYGI